MKLFSSALVLATAFSSNAYAAPSANAISDAQYTAMYNQAVGYIMASFEPIREPMEARFGSDIFDRIQSAYSLGVAVVDRNELLAIYNAITTGDLPEVQRLLQEFMAQYASMPEVIESFGADWIPLQKMIRAYRLGHLVNGQDLYEVAVGLIMQGFDDEIRQQLKAEFGDNIMNEIEQAYALGRAVVDRDELIQIYTAASAQDWPQVQALLQGFMAQYSQMPEVINFFGDRWIPMQTMIRNYRLGITE